MEQQQVRSSRPARNVSRRRFLAYTGAVAGSAALPGVSMAHAAPDTSRWSGRLPLLRSSFEGLEGSDFTLDDGRRLTLRSVTDLPVADTAAPARTAQHRFMVHFESVGSLGLSQDTYSLHHARMGRFALFIVPGSANQAVAHYSAVFNRL